jgi:flagellar biosynthesis GTPase FlhF
MGWRWWWFLRIRREAMIKSILARDFKGLTFETPIGQRTIFLGENGSGKSARAQSLTLALLGYIPGAQKTNAEILENFGKDVIVTGFSSDKGYVFERAFGRTKSGSVSQAFKVNGKKCTEEFFMATLGECGNPKILDLSVFLKLSDQKKIDYIFGLYPPSEDISGLDAMIETQKGNILKLESDARKSEDAAASLVANRAAMSLPSGTLAELTSEIEKTEKDLAEAQDNLKKIEIEEEKEKAAKEAKEKAEKEAAEKAEKLEKDRLAKEKKEREEKELAEKKQKELDAKKEEFQQNVKETVSDLKSENPKPVDIPASTGGYSLSDVPASFNAVLKAMNDAGCDSCAAKMVVKREARKFKNG